MISPVTPSVRLLCNWGVCGRLTLPNNVHDKTDIRIEKRICEAYNSGTPSPSSPQYSVHRGLYLCNWNSSGHSPPPKYTISNHTGNPTLCPDRRLLEGVEKGAEIWPEGAGDERVEVKADRLVGNIFCAPHCLLCFGECVQNAQLTNYNHVWLQLSHRVRLFVNVTVILLRGIWHGCAALQMCLYTINV